MWRLCEGGERSFPGLRLLLMATALIAISLVVAPPSIAATNNATSNATSNSPGPLLWTAPAGIDIQPIDSIACPSTALCVAVDRGGDVLWSTDPAAAPRSWQAADIDGSHELTSVSCPTTTLCVAVDAAGNVITSQDPTGGAAAWTVAKFDPSATQNNTDNAGSVLVRGVSCPSTTLCVAVDAAGNALVSTDPVGGATAWTITHIDTNTSHGCAGTGLTCQPPLVAVACPSTTQCAAVDFSGNLLTTAQPTATAPWTSTPTDGSGLSSLYGISCPLTTFCATVDGDQGRAITLNPDTPTAQTQRSLPDSLYGIWCQSPGLCLASAETQAGISGLLGSFDPAAPGSTWSLSSLGGVNAVACPSPQLCLAADDEGNVAAGATTTSITASLATQLLSPRALPTIASLVKRPYRRLTPTSLIDGLLTLTWTIPGPNETPIVLATATHTYQNPGTAILILRLTPAGRQLFDTATRPLTLTATASFAAGTGSVTATKRLTFRHPPKRKPKRTKRK